jgi:hypothetical protein
MSIKSQEKQKAQGKWILREAAKKPLVSRTTVIFVGESFKSKGVTMPVRVIPAGVNRTEYREKIAAEKRNKRKNK